MSTSSTTVIIVFSYVYCYYYLIHIYIYIYTALLPHRLLAQPRALLISSELNTYIITINKYININM